MPAVTAVDRATANSILARIAAQHDAAEGCLPALPHGLRNAVAAALAEQRERLVARHVADLERIALEFDIQREYVRGSVSVSDSATRCSAALDTIEQAVRERIAKLKGESNAH
jgi:hypothetical protein